MKLLLVSDFKLKTGYFTLGEAIATDLSAIGYDVTVMGVGYDQSVEHSYPFSLHPTIIEFVPQQMVALDDLFKFDWVAVMMDVPKQLSVYHDLERKKQGWLDRKNIISLFPVESDPFYSKWANQLKRWTKLRFTFSEFGKAECEKAGLPIHVLPYGPSPYWYEDIEPQITEHPYILTVAANQTRKNIPAAMAMALEVMKKRKAIGEELIHIIVSDLDSKDGWDLIEQGERMGFEKDTLVLLERDIVPNDVLRSLYRRASVFLLTSLSEGIGIPIYEAQAQGCPAVATNCCGIPEAIRSPVRLIDVAMETPTPWGNSTHYWPSIEDGAQLIDRMLTENTRVKVVYPPQESMARKMNLIIEMAEVAMKMPKVEHVAQEG